MVSDAGCWNVRPSGWKTTRLRVSDGATAVMLTESLRAPGGTESVCPPTTSAPPAGPIVCVTESAAMGEHLSRPALCWAVCTSESRRSPCIVGARAFTPRGERSPQLRTSTVAPPSSAERTKAGTFIEWFSCSQARSEEHTSELQSRLHLVCRLLLEKKKKI